VIAIIPYLALQLRAIALSASVVLDQGPHLNTTTNSVLLMTGVLAILAMMFGTRQIANTEQHGGLMLAVAFESFVKLSALICVAFFLFLKRRITCGKSVMTWPKLFMKCNYLVFQKLSGFRLYLQVWRLFACHASFMSRWSSCVMKNIFVALGVGLRCI
jgi:hypothetical protein